MDKRSAWSQRRYLGGFEEQDATLAAIGADADDAPLTFRYGSELLYGHADDARTGGAERMAKSHAATIRVQTLAREGAEVARHTSALGQEGLVLQRLEMERQLCGEGLTHLILDVAHPATKPEVQFSPEGDS